MEDLQEELWKGEVPIQFSLDASEVTTLHAPRPYYALVPRLGYLVSQTRSVIEYFRDVAPPVTSAQETRIWLDFDDVRLPWHLPCGLLWDLYSKRDTALPWKLTVHFQGAPSNELMPCESEQSVETHFMHSLKQAAYLRTGSTKTIMGLPRDQQRRIWTSIADNDYASYRHATSDLNLTSTNASSLRSLPIRVHLSSEIPIQMPIAPSVDDRPQLLEEVLTYLLPDLFPSNEHKVIVHGIQVPVYLSIIDLYRYFSYADGFLYIIVCPM